MKSSYTPDFRFIDIKGNITKDFEITNVIGSVLPGKSISFGIQYNPLNGFIDGKSNNNLRKPKLCRYKHYC